MPRSNSNHSAIEDKNCYKKSFEVSAYKEKLEKGGIQHKILSEELQADGSVIMEIKKQYNTSPVGDYLK